LSTSHPYSALASACRPSTALFGVPAIPSRQGSGLLIAGLAASRSLSARGYVELAHFGFIARGARKVGVEFCKEVELAQDQGNCVHLRPRKSQSHRRKAADNRGDHESACPSTIAARLPDSWARRDRSRRQESWLHPVLLKQLVQAPCGIVGIEWCPNRIRCAVLQQINSILLRQIGHQKSNDLERPFSR
jgi:hypothetical protein